MTSDSFILTPVVLSLKYVRVPVEETCANCRRSTWGQQHSTKVRIHRDYLFCPIRYAAVHKYLPACIHYVPPTKTHTLFVHVCRRNRLTGEELT